MRRFLLSSTLNTRDLGGYPIDYGRATAYKTFIRSDVPHKLSDEDIQMLLSNNITTIVDLRSDEETENKPCALRDHNDFEYYHSKIYGDGYLPKCVEEVPLSYFEIVDEQNTILNTMRLFSKAKGGILYHCTAGKDRTGVVSALLLLLAGVSKTDILADYQISQVYLNSMLQQYCKSNKNVDINIITPKMEHMEKFLDMFLEKYNSVEEYFSKIGLKDCEVMKLKKKLVGA
ncbi:tyrosine-protein phosphatase [Clostridium folliculivorans]|uniref:Protein-tyrosine-phosphatase n=1 Tax=Clostridium folliculivorans TaxID=2886038 RepID=A0A9W5Y1W5_9CLOT|nr:tyrosine-protein phosphatase [Clostridium folliculivorans]GKU25209.1 protein-tyrosine-phosphatase [Clostridium folliculivorans]GKU31307.1 protein-tyrosine-phosphatase [Clostridium folliculivorans]